MGEGQRAAADILRRRRHWPGLLDFYLVRGVAGTFLLILLAVGAAMILERALRLARDLAASGGDVAYFLPLLVRLSPYYLNLALPAAFMVALVLLVARLDERLELEAMLASGWSLSRVAAPLVALGILLGLAGVVVGGWLEPLGRYHFRSMHIEALNAGRIARLQPRAIYHPSDNLVITFDRPGADGGAEGIFVWQRLEDGRELILTSRSGRIGIVPGARMLGIDLGTGRYVAQRPGTARAPPYVVGFDSLAFRESLQLRESAWERGWDQKELTLPELFSEAKGGARGIPEHALETEYLARLASPALMPLLPLLVLPLCFATKKGRRGLGIVLCGILLAAFHHGMNMAKQLALERAVDAGPAILGTAALCIAIILLVFLSGRHLPSHSPITAALSRFRYLLPRPSFRRRTLPGPSGLTLATYLAWNLAKWTTVSLLGIVALLQMVDLFDRGQAFVDRDMGFGDVAFYAWLRLPMTLQQALPIASLAGAMITFVMLGRSCEMIAIRSAGLSQWRVLWMALPVPLSLAAAGLLLSDSVVPPSELRFASWWSATAPADTAADRRARWFRIGDEIVQAAAAAADGTRLHAVRIFRRAPSGLLSERISAATASLERGRWTLSDVAIDTFEGSGPPRDPVARMEWNTSLLPGDVAAFFSSSRALSTSAARRALGVSAPVSQAESLFATRLHRSVAEPLAPILMVLLALPLAFLPPRGGRSGVAFLYAGAGGLAYLVTDGVFTVVAQVGYLSAAAGAWAAPALFGLMAMTVLLYSER